MLRGARRARHRPAGRRHAHLHLHLHDGELPARPPAGTACRSSCAIGRIRSAASAVEGPMLVPGFESFVGQFPIPMRHGMTIGELARFFNDALRHRREARSREDAGLVARAVRRRDRPAVGAAVAEHADARHRRRLSRARCCSKARTSPKAAARRKPFELVGAPWVDPERFAADLNARGLPGVHFRPALFEPTFHKHAGPPCGGCQIHVTDRDDVPQRRNRRGGDRRVSRRGSRPVRVARAAVRIRVHEAADRHPVRVRGAARRARPRRSRGRDLPALGGRRSRRSSTSGRGICFTERMPFLPCRSIPSRRLVPDEACWCRARTVSRADRAVRCVAVARARRRASTPPAAQGARQ